MPKVLKLSETFSTVTIKKDVTLDQVRSMLCNAFEGGMTNSWCRIDGYQYADGIRAADFKAGGKCISDEYWHPCQSVPTVEGCALKLCITEDPGFKVQDDWEPGAKTRKEDGEGCKYLLLTPEKLKQGLEFMANYVPKHFNDWMDENDDAITGDVFLQCCLFPDYAKEKKHVVFG